MFDEDGTKFYEGEVNHEHEEKEDSTIVAKFIFHGQGTLFWKNGNKRREGKWKYDLFVSGTEYKEDGTKVYEGEFKEYVEDEVEEEYDEESQKSGQDQNSKPSKT